MKEKMNPKKVAESLKNLDAVEVLKQALRVPGVKIDREKFLTKELEKTYSEMTIETAVKYNPAYAGVMKSDIETLAMKTIAYETGKVSAVSFAAGLPGGFAMAATIPADVIQYFAFMARAMQKLAYLYGFKEFDFDEEHLSEETIDRILIFMGVMFSVKDARDALNVLAASEARNIVSTMEDKAKYQSSIYPIARQTAKILGVRMAKQILAESVGKIMPLIGGVASGGLSYVSFRPCCIRLKQEMEQYRICNPSYYMQEIYDEIDGDEE